jgi:hypothetical protein
MTRGHTALREVTAAGPGYTLRNTPPVVETGAADGVFGNFHFVVILS